MVVWFLNFWPNMKKLRLGIIGDPIIHSLSPIMHEAALHALGIEGSYTPLQVSSNQLSSVISQRRENWDGWNVTVPHKGNIIPLLDTIETQARKINSVNTVVRLKDHRLWGTSTDGYGLIKALECNLNFIPNGTHVVLLGAGGAARAAAAALALADISKLTIINRTPEKAMEIVNFVKTLSSCQTEIMTPSQIIAPLSSGDLVIQATSLGLKEIDPLPFSPQFLPEKCCVFDMIYSSTPFLQQSQRLGFKTSDGLEMLLYQGVKSFEYWTNQEAPVEIMRQTLYHAKGRK